MKIHSNPWLWSAVAAGCLASAASAQAPIFNETFDGYGPVGGTIQPQGGWHQWGAAPDPLTSLIEDEVSGFRRSGRSVSVDALAGGITSDLVQTFAAADPTKKYTLRGWTYAPSGALPPNIAATDKWYFIVMNTYAEPAGPFKWSVQVTMDPAFTAVIGDVGSTTAVQTALLLDQWVEMRAEVDFATDDCQVYYGATLLDDPNVPGPGYPWSNGVFGQDIGTLAGVKTVAAYDLYHGPVPPGIGNSKAYWDDVNLNQGFPPAKYCAAKLSSQGCFPTIGASGSSSAASFSGWTMETINARFNKPGLYLYGLNPAGGAFQGGTLCIGPPIRRTPGMLAVGNAVSAGFAADCRGIYRFDFNAYAHTTPPVNAPHPLLLVPGSVFNVQCWGRDAGDAFGSLLSDALTFTVGS